MPSEQLLTLSGVFLSVAFAAGAFGWWFLSSNAEGRKRIRNVSQPRVSGLLINEPTLTEAPNRRAQKIASIIPKSPKDLTRLQRQMTTAGYPGAGAAVYYSAAELVLPVVFGVAAWAYLGLSGGHWMVVLGALVLGYTAPAIWLSRKTSARQRTIENGLPDALDLFIVCLEAGSSLDQAIVKASEEFEIAHPALAGELRILITETRAGKPRLEAFKNFAARTKVDDVRSLVAMLGQTEKFGTSISQALRTHAATSRAKRRSRAEEKAAKVGTKLAFPLVLFLFPAFYVVVLGPAIVQIYKGFIVK